MPTDNWTPEDYEADRRARKAIRNKLGWLQDRGAWMVAAAGFIAMLATCGLLYKIITG